MKLNSPNNSNTDSKQKSINNKQPSNIRKKSISNSRVELEWMAIYLDNKFYLTTPSAYQKLMNLDREIIVEKQKFQKINQQQANTNTNEVNNDQGNPQAQIQQNKQENSMKQGVTIIPKQHNKPRKNSLQSAMSRQCRTQINELQLLKAKIYAQKQLVQQQIKFHNHNHQNQNKTMEVRKRRMLKDSTTFVVRNNNHNNIKDRSVDQSSQRNYQQHNVQFKKNSDKKFMMAPHQLSSRRSQDKDIDRSFQASISQAKRNDKDSRYRQSQRYQTIQPKSIKNNDQSQQQYQNTVKASMNSESRQQNRYFLSSKQKSKSKQKSFVITSRKSPSSSNNYNNQSESNAKDSKISNSRHQQHTNSRASQNQKQQIKQLTSKLKQMQQKLAQVQKKQHQLEEIQKQKQKAYDALFQSRESSKMNSKISRSVKSKYNNNINTNVKKEQVDNENNVNEKILSKNTHQISNIPSDFKCSTTANQINQQKIIQQNHKQKESENVSKKSQRQSRKQKQLQKQLQLQELQRKFQQKQKKLSISNTIVAYNYNDDLQKQKKQTQQLNSKLKMSEQIQQLKKVIKQLKIQKIKQEALINDFQNGNTYNNRQMKKNNNFIDVNFSQMTFKEQQSKVQSSVKNDSSFSFRQNVLECQDVDSKNNQIINVNVKVQDSFQKDKPLVKKQPRRMLKIQTAQKYNQNANITQQSAKNNTLTKSNGLNSSITSKSNSNSDANRNNNNNGNKSQQISYNPEQSNKKYYQNQEQQRRESCIMKKRGIIIKQIINKQKFQTISVQSKKSSQKGESKQLPLSSISKANKQQEKQKSQQLPQAGPSNQILKSQQSKTQINLFPQQNLQQFTKPPIIIPDLPQQIQTFPIPDLPSTPLAQTSQSQVLQLAVKICNIFQIKINGKQSLQFKKYKNCVILKTLEQYGTGNNINNNNHSSTLNKAIVWHFSGKFYIGGWYDPQINNRNADSNSTTEDQKNGEGFEFVPGKHYYRGEFKNGKRNGYGTMITLDGNIYQGSWVNGEKCGKGVSFEKGTNTMYQGQWKDGKKEGKGILKTSNKQFYEGEFEKSIKSGQGTELFANGDVYIGSYKNGKFNGQGKYFWANGSIYVGNFVDGQRQGYGKWRSSLIDGDQYEGQYKKDKKSGKGKYYWTKGCVFEGEFIADLKHGQGRVDYQDGRQVKGVWQYGKLKQIHKSENENDQTFHSLDIEPRIRPNIPRMVQSPSKQMQESKLVHGV